MNFMFTKKVGIVILFLLSFASYSYAQQQQLIIGTLNYNPPFEQVIKSQNVFFGFNIEVIKSLCAVMKKDCKLIPMRFDKLINALDENKVDAIIVGI